MLAGAGYDVDVIDLFWFGNALPRTINATHGDLFDLDAEALRAYDQVIFLAGLSNDPMAEYDPARNFIDNAAAPSYLAFMAKKAGVKRFIYASSCSVYGFTENELYNESSPANSAYPYGISKLQGERGVLQLQDDSYSVIALRQGTVCGYSPRMRFDLIVNTMYKCAILDRHITVNNPAIWRPIIDVRDASRAFVLAVQAAPEISGVFNVAYDNFTVGQIAEQVKAKMDELLGSTVRITTNHVQDVRNYKVSSEKASKLLAFDPQFGVAAMLDTIHAHRAAYADFTDDAYYNIATFKKLDSLRRAGIGF